MLFVSHAPGFVKSRVQRGEPLTDTQLWFTQQLVEHQLDVEQLTPFGQACFNQIRFTEEEWRRQQAEGEPHALH